MSENILFLTGVQLEQFFAADSAAGKTVVLFDYKESLKKCDELGKIKPENIFDCKLACYIYDPALDCSTLEKCANSLSNFINFYKMNASL